MKVKVKVMVEVDENDIDKIDDIISEMDYFFKHEKIVDTEITDWEFPYDE